MSFRKAFMLASILLAGAAAVCSAEPGQVDGSVAPARAWPGPMPGRPMGMGFGLWGRALMGELDLTPAQREHIAQQRSRQTRERIQRSAEIHIAS